MGIKIQPNCPQGQVPQISSQGHTPQSAGPEGSLQASPAFQIRKAPTQAGLFVPYKEHPLTAPVVVSFDLCVQDKPGSAATCLPGQTAPGVAAVPGSREAAYNPTAALTGRPASGLNLGQAQPGLAGKLPGEVLAREYMQGSTCCAAA